MKFGDFGAQNQMIWWHFVILHVFKAKKVMVWDVSRRFAKSALSIAKANFFVEFLFSGGIPHFSGEKCISPVPGLQNSSQNLTLIKGFAPGARKSPFGAKRRNLGPRNALVGGNTIISGKWEGHSWKWKGTLEKLAQQMPSLKNVLGQGDPYKQQPQPPAPPQRTARAKRR